MTTTTLNGHSKDFIGLNPSEEALDVDKMESTIRLDDTTKEKILNKHRKRIARKELSNADLKATIEKNELKQKLEAAKVGTFEQAFLEQKKSILKLLQASFFSTIVFLLILPTVLSFTHAYSIASMAERLGGNFLSAYIIGWVFSGLFEGLLLGLVLQFAHKPARFSQYAAMLVLAIISSIEVFKKGIDVLQLTDVVRLVGGIFLIPVIKAYVGKIRDKAEGKGKKLFERLSEETQKSMKDDFLFLQSELKKWQAIPTKTEQVFDKKSGRTKTITKKERIHKIDRFNFREYSNAKGILEHDLKKKLVEYGIFTNTLWKELPSKRETAKQQAKRLERIEKQKERQSQKPNVNNHPENEG